jgi:hypothetical protein
LKEKTSSEERLQTAVNDITGAPIRGTIPPTFRSSYRVCDNCNKKDETTNMHCVMFELKPSEGTCVKFRGK